MAKIVSVEVLQVDLAPKVKRSDAIQSFQCQETPIVRVTDSDGVTGTGYSYTIGTGGSSVIKLLDDHLVLPRRERAIHHQDQARAHLWVPEARPVEAADRRQDDVVEVALAALALELGWGIVGVWAALDVLIAVRLALLGARFAGRRWLVTGWG